MRTLHIRRRNVTIKDMKQKIKPFYQWLDENDITLAAFSSQTGLGMGTAASLRSKSVNGAKIVIHRGTALSISTVYPKCPLLLSAVIV